MQTDQIKIKDLSDAQKRELCYPDVFAEVILGMKGLYPKQKEILRALHPKNAKISVRTCNESGKTSKLVTAAILWHGALFPKGVCTSTSGSWGQVVNQLVPNLKRFSNRFPYWTFNAKDIRRKDGTPIWIGYSTNDEGKAEGYHGNDDEPLLAIVDEAKTVPDGIYGAIDRCNAQRTAYFSSPGTAEGEFYRSQTKDAHLYQVWKIDASECPHISRESIDRRIAKYGADHPLIRSMIHAEFMDKVENAILSFNEIEKCLETPPMVHAGERHAFCDFAAGGDENVLAVRVGNKVWIEDAWRDQNTMSAVGRFVTNFNRLKSTIGLRSIEIDGDADGMGKVMVDAINDAGWEINAFHGNSTPLSDNHYYNRIAEVWFEGAKQIKQCKIVLPRDEDLTAQLMNRKQRFKQDGSLALESKEDMRKRGVSSPDRADAVLGAMADLQLARSISTDDRNAWAATKDDPFVELPDDMTIDAGALAGINAGL